MDIQDELVEILRVIYVSRFVPALPQGAKSPMNKVVLLTEP